MSIVRYVVTFVFVCCAGMGGGCSALVASSAGKAVAQNVVIAGGKKVAEKVVEKVKEDEPKK